MFTVSYLTARDNICSNNPSTDKSMRDVLVPPMDVFLCLFIFVRTFKALKDEHLGVSLKFPVIRARNICLCHQSLKTVQ